MTAAAGAAQGTRAASMCSNFVWAISARPELICESGKALTTDIRRSFEDFNDLFLCHSSPKSLLLRIEEALLLWARRGRLGTEEPPCVPVSLLLLSTDSTRVRI
jgi:hypothetical protein